MATDRRPIPPSPKSSGNIIDVETMRPVGYPEPRGPRSDKGAFGKRSNGMDNPTSFRNGIYDAMSAQADKLHPVKKRK